jgi:hypothetical protein
MSLSLDDAVSKLNMALGKDGTGLCIVKRIFAEGENIREFLLKVKTLKSILLKLFVLLVNHQIHPANVL